jgi:hypothetical protein
MARTPQDVTDTGLAALPTIRRLTASPPSFPLFCVANGRAGGHTILLPAERPAATGERLAAGPRMT